jgi:anti-sigma B factor antagonist
MLFGLKQFQLVELRHAADGYTNDTHGGAMSFFYITDDAPIEGESCEQDVVVMVAGGDIDYSSTPQLRECIANHVDSGKRRLVVDMSKVTFIDSTAIGVLIGALMRLQEAGGGSVAVVCDQYNKKVLRIFEIAGVDNLIALHGTREDALSALAVAG